MRTVVQLLNAAALVANGNTNTVGLGPDITQVTAFINVTAATGTAPSAVFTLQLSPTGAATDWFDAATGAALTAAGNQRITVPSNVGDFAQ